MKTKQYFFQDFDNVNSIITNKKKSSSLLDFFVRANLGWACSFLISCTLVVSWSSIVKAQNPDTVPSELQEIVNEIETAANNQDLEALLEYYSADFTNTDGLTYASLSEAIKQMWQNYPQLQYKTEIQSWEQVGDELVAETVTLIKGNRQNKGRVIELNSTLRSRQYFQEEKLVRQEILSEKTELTSGENPPKVNVVVPEKVKVGEKYHFDVIVTEPLGNSVLLGGVIEENTSSDRYLNPTSLELEPLPAGGIYKLVTAPRLSDRYWLSAILVRGDGITMVTKRVSIVDSQAQNLQP
jgi:hypothetical protein